MLEYEPRHRTTDWYWAVGIIAISAAAGAVLIGNLLFALLIVVGTLSLVAHTHQAPKELRIEITKRGIAVNSDLYLFDALESFWIHEYEHAPRLVIRSKRLVMPYITLPLPTDLVLSEIREVLAAYLKEEIYHEPISQKIMEYLGF